MRADDQDPLSTGMFYCKVNRMLWKLVMSLIIYFPSLSFSSYVFLGKKVLQRHFLRSGKVLGTFKLDVATVMAQPGIITNSLKISFENISSLYVSTLWLVQIPIWLFLLSTLHMYTFLEQILHIAKSFYWNSMKSVVTMLWAPIRRT